MGQLVRIVSQEADIMEFRTEEFEGYLAGARLDYLGIGGKPEGQRDNPDVIFCVFCDRDIPIPIMSQLSRKDILADDDKFWGDFFYRLYKHRTL